MSHSSGAQPAVLINPSSPGSYPDASFTPTSSDRFPRSVWGPAFEYAIQHPSPYGGTAGPREPSDAAAAAAASASTPVSGPVPVSSASAVSSSQPPPLPLASSSAAAAGSSSLSSSPAAARPTWESPAVEHRSPLRDKEARSVSSASWSTGRAPSHPLPAPSLGARLGRSDHFSGGMPSRHGLSPGGASDPVTRRTGPDAAGSTASTAAMGVSMGMAVGMNMNMNISMGMGMDAGIRMGPSSSWMPFHHGGMSPGVLPPPQSGRTLYETPPFMPRPGPLAHDGYMTSLPPTASSEFMGTTGAAHLFIPSSTGASTAMATATTMTTATTTITATTAAAGGVSVSGGSPSTSDPSRGGQRGTLRHDPNVWSPRGFGLAFGDMPAHGHPSVHSSPHPQSTPPGHGHGPHGPPHASAHHPGHHPGHGHDPSFGSAPTPTPTHPSDAGPWDAMMPIGRGGMHTMPGHHHGAPVHAPDEAHRYASELPPKAVGSMYLWSAESHLAPLFPERSLPSDAADHDAAFLDRGAATAYALPSASMPPPMVYPPVDGISGLATSPGPYPPAHARPKPHPHAHGSPSPTAKGNGYGSMSTHAGAVYSAASGLEFTRREVGPMTPHHDAAMAALSSASDHAHITHAMRSRPDAASPTKRHASTVSPATATATATSNDLSSVLSSTTLGPRSTPQHSALGPTSGSSGAAAATPTPAHRYAPSPGRRAMASPAPTTAAPASASTTATATATASPSAPTPASALASASTSQHCDGAANDAPLDGCTVYLQGFPEWIRMKDILNVASDFGDVVNIAMQTVSSPAKPKGSPGRAAGRAASRAPDAAFVPAAAPDGPLRRQAKIDFDSEANARAMVAAGNGACYFGMAAPAQWMLSVEAPARDAAAAAAASRSTTAAAPAPAITTAPSESPRSTPRRPGTLTYGPVAATLAHGSPRGAKDGAESAGQARTPLSPQGDGRPIGPSHPSNPGNPKPIRAYRLPGAPPAPTPARLPTAPHTALHATPSHSNHHPAAYAHAFTVFIGNLPWNIEKSTLESLLADFSVLRIHSVSKPRDQRAFAFITFATSADAQRAVQIAQSRTGSLGTQLHHLCNGAVKVEFAKKPVVNSASTSAPASAAAPPFAASVTTTSSSETTPRGVGATAGLAPSHASESAASAAASGHLHSMPPPPPPAHGHGHGHGHGLAHTPTKSASLPRTAGHSHSHAVSDPAPKGSGASLAAPSGKPKRERIPRNVVYIDEVPESIVFERFKAGFSAYGHVLECFVIPRRDPPPPEHGVAPALASATAAAPPLQAHETTTRHITAPYGLVIFENAEDAAKSTTKKLFGGIFPRRRRVQVWDVRATFGAAPSASAFALNSASTGVSSSSSSPKHDAVAGADPAADADARAEADAGSGAGSGAGATGDREAVSSDELERRLREWFSSVGLIRRILVDPQHDHVVIEYFRGEAAAKALVKCAQTPLRPNTFVQAEYAQGLRRRDDPESDA